MPGSPMVKLASREACSVPARVAARIAYAFATQPDARRVVVYQRSATGHLMVRASETFMPEVGLLGVYGPDVTIRQLVEDLAGVEDGEA